ncbi:MAG TPA: hypothetical protein VHU89_09400 [Acidobacteriaceae bacterium]|jgi:hypothetical protein|nr:hypothetical protein [Acidobacteriaceae bacterium]
MKKATRYLVLCGVLALSAAPVFAVGPGGGDPPPPPTKSGAIGTGTTGTTGTTTTDIVGALLAYLGV